jgi:hypothetical protein
MHDIFWSPANGDLVQLKPAAAALWPFHVERDKPFLVQHIDMKHATAWITPEDKKRRWHSAPTQVDELMPFEAIAAQAAKGDAA